MRERQDAHLVLQYGNFDSMYRRLIGMARKISGMYTVRPRMAHTSFLKLQNLTPEEIEQASHYAKEATMMLKGSRVKVTGTGIFPGYRRDLYHMTVSPEVSLEMVTQAMGGLPVREPHISMGYISTRQAEGINGSHGQAIKRLIDTLDQLTVTKAELLVKKRGSFHGR